MEMANFDGAAGSATGRWNSRGPRDSLVQVLAVQHVISGKLLLRLGEGTFGRQDLAVVRADRSGCIGSPEPIHSHKDATLPSFVHYCRVALPNLLSFLRQHGIPVAFCCVDKHHVEHGIEPPARDCQFAGHRYDAWETIDR